jgi:chorismate mutase
MGDLKQLRGEIDAIDEQIMRFLAKRVKVCEAVGTSKKMEGLPVHDAKREEEVLKRVRQKATELGLSSIQVEAVYREIVNMCSSVQE